VDLGLLNSFVTVNISRVEVVPPHPTPNLENQRLHFIWPLPFDLSGIGDPTGAYAPSNIALWVIGACKPFHNKVVVLEEDYGKYKSKIYIQTYFTLQAHNVW
jgi:hypothetical protein